MRKGEEKKVKLAARLLLHRLREEHPKVLVQDWYKDSHSQSKVKLTVEDVLDKILPEGYDKIIFRSKCNTLYSN